MRLISLIFLITFFHIKVLFSQTIDFAYDANGNRISRTLIVEQLQSQDISSIILDQEIFDLTAKNLKSEKSTKCVDSISEGEEIQISFYPNPNQGILNIGIKNMPLDALSEIRLFDLSGTQLLMINDIPDYFEINIRHLKDGIYILRIKVNTEIFNYKVIKAPK